MANAALSPAKEFLAPEKILTPFDRRVADILEDAAKLFGAKGFEGTSMRDLSKLTRISLAGLYHYVPSKEALLYTLQRQTFEQVLASARARVAAAGASPEQRLRAFIASHLDYFLQHREAMKVLSHEDEVLARMRSERRNGDRDWAAEIARLKRAYYAVAVDVVRGVTERGVGNRRGDETQARVQTMALFGMLNWVYTWHRTDRDPGAEQLAGQMADLFLSGVMARREHLRASAPTTKRRRNRNSKSNFPRNGKRRA